MSTAADRAWFSKKSACIEGKGFAHIAKSDVIDAFDVFSVMATVADGWLERKIGRDTSGCGNSGARYDDSPPRLSVNN